MDKLSPRGREVGLAGCSTGVNRIARIHNEGDDIMAIYARWLAVAAISVWCSFVGEWWLPLLGLGLAAGVFALILALSDPVLYLSTYSAALYRLNKKVQAVSLLASSHLVHGGSLILCSLGVTCAFSAMSDFYRPRILMALTTLYVPSLLLTCCLTREERSVFGSQGIRIKCSLLIGGGLVAAFLRERVEAGWVVTVLVFIGLAVLQTIMLTLIYVLYAKHFERQLTPSDEL